MPLDALMAKMLVLVAHTTNEAIPMGTGFLISGDGKFVTAEHVASGLKELVDAVHGEATAVKALIPRAADGGAMLAKKLWTNPEDDHQAADITVGILSLPVGTPPLPAFEVAFDQLAVGETLMVLGFASMTKKMDSDETPAFVLDAELKVTLTTVTALYPDGYTNLRGPVFEMAASMDPGMSGGPIIRVATGEVVGLCSKGSKAPGLEPYCFGSVLPRRHTTSIHQPGHLTAGRQAVDFVVGHVPGAILLGLALRGGSRALISSRVASIVTRNSVNCRDSVALERASAQVTLSRDGQCCRDDRSRNPRLSDS